MNQGGRRLGVGSVAALAGAADTAAFIAGRRSRMRRVYAGPALAALALGDALRQR